MVIASQHPEAERRRSGQCMEERFLFDWVERDASCVSVWHIQYAAFVVTHLANAIVVRRNLAPMPARETPQPVVGHLFIELAFFYMSRKKIVECKRFWHCGVSDHL
jgi:hypothetical protein